MIIHSKIFKSGSFACSWVNLKLCFTALSSNSSLAWGFLKAKPIRHWPAEELNFLAVLMKMMSCYSGLTMFSTMTLMFTTYDGWYVSKGNSRYSSLLFFHKCCSWYVLLVGDSDHCWSHSKCRSRFCLRSHSFWTTIPPHPALLPATKLWLPRRTSPA